MTIKTTVYSPDQIGEYIKQIRRTFQPVSDGWAAIKRNAVFTTVFYIFAFISGVFAAIRIGQYFWETDKWMVYIFWLVTGFIVVKNRQAKDTTDPLYEARIDGAIAVEDLIYGLEQLEYLYLYLDEVQKELKEKSDNNISLTAQQLSQILNTDDTLQISPNFSDNGVIDFTEIDQKFEEYKKNAQELKDICIKSRIL